MPLLSRHPHNVVAMVPCLPVIPAKAGIHAYGACLGTGWIPAFAGMTKEDVFGFIVPFDQAQQINSTE
jgi:hypothetical protein